MVGKHSYNFYHYYICLECKNFMDNHSEYFVEDDGFWSNGDIGEGRRQYLLDKNESENNEDKS